MSGRLPFYSVKWKNSSYGVATFSRYPIKMTLEIPFENTANATIRDDRLDTFCEAEKGMPSTYRLSVGRSSELITSCTTKA